MKKYFETKDFYNVANILFEESYDTPMQRKTDLLRVKSMLNIEHVEYYSFECLPECEVFIINALIKDPMSIRNLSFKYEIPFTEAKTIPTKLQTIVNKLNEQLEQLYYKENK